MVFLKRLALLCALTINAFATIAAGTVFEVRSTGSDSNGGGYVTGSSGTDYSQQNTAHCAVTDLVLVTSTTMTSVTCPFDATSVGNIMQQTAGTNFTVGFFQVLSVVGVTATVDRSAGTAGATGGTFALGGALASPNKACATMQTGNIEYVKSSATYTVTTTCAIGQNGSGIQFQFIGYTTTRGDNGKATWTTATNSTPLISYNGAPVIGLTIQNFTFTNTAGTRSQGITNNGSVSVAGLVVYNCSFDGFSTAIVIRAGGGSNPGAFIERVEVKNSTGDGIQLGTSANSISVSLINVYSHNNTGSGINIAGIGLFTFSNVNASSNTLDGIHMVTPGVADDIVVSIVNSILANNTSDGLESTSATIKSILVVDNTIVYGNTGFGIKMGILPSFQHAVANAFGANGTNLQNFSASSSDVALSANPFTNSGSGDYSLNSTAGGGAALKAVGFPGVSLFGTGFIDIGALQSAVPAVVPVQVSTGYTF